MLKMYTKAKLVKCHKYPFLMVPFANIAFIML